MSFKNGRNSTRFWSSVTQLLSFSFFLHLCFESGELSTKLSCLKLSERVFGECESFFLAIILILIAKKLFIF